MASVAHAYSRLGEVEKFDDAMARYQASLEWQVAQGADNWALTLSRAHFAMLSGDREAAVSLLEQAFGQGLIQTIRLTMDNSVFAPLRGEERFETVLSRMHERLNQQRASLGLEPVST
jgi:hypothetical protein